MNSNTAVIRQNRSATNVSVVFDSYEAARSNVAYVGFYINPQKIKRLKKLNSIEKLEDNWNGNGATFFSKNLIAKIRKFVLFSTHVPEIFPTAEGAVQLEYDRGNGAHLEIEVFLNKAEVYQTDSNGKEKYWDIDSDVKSLDKVVTAFYE